MRIALLPILLVCVSGSLQAQSKKRCADTPIDSTNPLAPVYQECHVERRAKVRSTGPRPQFTPVIGGGANPSCYRATFEFVVDSAGKPELATVRRLSSTDQSYADAVEASLGGLLYEPGRVAKSPVRQVVRFESRLGVRMIVVSSSTGGAPGARTAPLTPRPPNC